MLKYFIINLFLLSSQEPHHASLIHALPKTYKDPASRDEILDQKGLPGPCFSAEVATVLHD